MNNDFLLKSLELKKEIIKKDKESILKTCNEINSIEIDEHTKIYFYEMLYDLLKDSDTEICSTVISNINYLKNKQQMIFYFKLLNREEVTKDQIKEVLNLDYENDQTYLMTDFLSILVKKIMFLNDEELLNLAIAKISSLK